MTDLQRSPEAEAKLNENSVPTSSNQNAGKYLLPF